MGPTNRHEIVEEMRSAQHLFDYFEKQFGEGAAGCLRDASWLQTTQRNPNYSSSLILDAGLNKFALVCFFSWVHVGTAQIGWCNTVVTIALLERLCPLGCATERVLAEADQPRFENAWYQCAVVKPRWLLFDAFCTCGELVVFSWFSLVSCRLLPSFIALQPQWGHASTPWNRCLLQMLLLFQLGLFRQVPACATVTASICNDNPFLQSDTSTEPTAIRGFDHWPFPAEIWHFYTFLRSLPSFSIIP